MAYCVKCGVQMDDNANFCPKCGTRSAAQTVDGDFTRKATETFNKVMDTPDNTSAFDPADIEYGKGLALISYIGPLALIPFFVEKQSRYVRYHAVRGMYLFLAEIAASIATGLLYGILWFIWPVASIVSSIVWLTALGLSITGIVYAATGKAKDLPLVGSLTKLGWFR